MHEEGEFRDVERQAVVRTPSPTPSETGMLEGSIWNPTGKKKTQWRECMSKDSLGTYLHLLPLCLRTPGSILMWTQ